MLALRRGNILPFRAMVDGKYVLSSFFLSIQFILFLLILCNVVFLFVCNCCWFQLPRTLTSLFYLNLFVSRIMYWELYQSVTTTCYLEVIDVIAKIVDRTIIGNEYNNRYETIKPQYLKTLTLMQIRWYHSKSDSIR